MENRTMEQLKTTITREDILDGPVYEEQREEERERIWKIKNNRRLSVGPHATFYFECYDTMLYQIHEMVRIEKGGEEQISDELEAYNSLVPNGKEFVATLMFEINDPDYRTQILNGLGGVEKTIELTVGGSSAKASPETDLDRTKESGKTSAVHFVRFELTEEVIDKMKKDNPKVVIAINHPNYGHAAVLGEATLAELKRDLAL